MPDLSYRLGEHDPGYLCINPGQLAEGSRFIPDAEAIEANKAFRRERLNAPEGFALFSDVARALGISRDTLLKRLENTAIRSRKIGVYRYVHIVDVQRIATNRGWPFDIGALK